MECVLRKFGSYENFEEVTGGTVLPKSQVWAAVRKYLQKEGCVGEVSDTQHIQRQVRALIRPKKIRPDPT